MASSARDVFINCPFDDDFAPVVRSLVVAVTRCGFVRAARARWTTAQRPVSIGFTELSRRAVTASMLASYDGFVVGLPEIADAAGLDSGALLYADYDRLVIAWVKNEANVK